MQERNLSAKMVSVILHTIELPHNITVFSLSDNVKLPKLIKMLQCILYIFTMNSKSLSHTQCSLMTVHSVLGKYMF